MLQTVILKEKRCFYEETFARDYNLHYSIIYVLYFSSVYWANRSNCYGLNNVSNDACCIIRAWNSIKLYTEILVSICDSDIVLADHTHLLQYFGTCAFIMVFCIISFWFNRWWTNQINRSKSRITKE